MIWHEFIGEISWKRESFKEILPFFEPERKKSDKYQFWVRKATNAMKSSVIVVFEKIISLIKWYKNEQWKPMK